GLLAGFDMYIEFGCRDARPSYFGCVDPVSRKINRRELLLQVLQIETHVDQRADDHIAAYAREAVEIECAHNSSWDSPGSASPACRSILPAPPSMAERCSGSSGNSGAVAAAYCLLPPASGGAGPLPAPSLTRLPQKLRQHLYRLT